MFRQLRLIFEHNGSNAYLKLPGAGTTSHSRKILDLVYFGRTNDPSCNVRGRRQGGGRGKRWLQGPDRCRLIVFCRASPDLCASDGFCALFLSSPDPGKGEPGFVSAGPMQLKLLRPGLLGAGEGGGQRSDGQGLGGCVSAALQGTGRRTPPHRPLIVHSSHPP